MKQTILVGILSAVIFGGAGYFLGTKVTNKSPVARFSAGGNFAGGNLAERAGGAGRTGNNAVFGTVISKDENGVTVQLGGPGATSTNGTASGTRIVLVNSATQVSKMSSGSSADLSPGTGVVVTGTTNSDGSLTATTVQIRPAGAQR